MKMVPDNHPGEQDFELLRTLTEGFCTPATFPISFWYGEKKQTGVPWHATTSWKRIDSNLTHLIIKSTDPETGLEIKAVCEQYADFPVLEWTVYLTNKGEQNTPPIRDLMGMDAVIKLQRPLLQYGSGDRIGNKGYEFFERPIADDVFEMQPVGGKCCNAAFPYMRIVSAEEQMGFLLSVGWPGQWKAQLSLQGSGTLVKAGQATTSFYLKPGETVRTPRMTMLAFMGDERRATNLWRRWYMAHVIPKNGGKSTQPMLIAGNVADPKKEGYSECTGWTHKGIAESLNVYDRQGIQYDLFWLDAGWYDCGRWWRHTGTWKERQPNYPDGLLGVKQSCDAHGIKLLVWFEPERVFKGTDIERQHPEWLLRKNGDQELIGRDTEHSPESSLFNIGNPEACAYLSDMICEFLKRNRIDWYREDFNVCPLPYWEANDEVGRWGMLENQYVQGYLKFWDEILRRNPGIQIDSCASGGCRNDLETMRRSVPLHYSDFGYGNHPVKMGFEQTMHEWFPYFKSNAMGTDYPDGSYPTNEDEWDEWEFARSAKCEREDEDSKRKEAEKKDAVARSIDFYDFYCALAPAIVPAIGSAEDEEGFAVVRAMQDSWRKAAGIMLRGDFYALTKYHKDAEKWWCRQFDDPERGEGFLLFVTGNRCAEDIQTVYPYMREEEDFLFENRQTGEQRRLTGKEVSNGFQENLSPRSGSIWFYRKA